jgi:hypothetical protein
MGEGVRGRMEKIGDEDRGTGCKRRSGDVRRLVPWTGADRRGRGEGRGGVPVT